MHLLRIFYKNRSWKRLLKLLLVTIAALPTLLVERDLALVHVYIYYITALLLVFTTLRILFELNKVCKLPERSLKTLMNCWLLAGVLIFTLPIVFWYS